MNLLSAPGRLLTSFQASAVFLLLQSSMNAMLSMHLGEATWITNYYCTSIWWHLSEGNRFRAYISKSGLNAWLLFRNWSFLILYFFFVENGVKNAKMKIYSECHAINVRRNTRKLGISWLISTYGVPCLVLPLFS